MTYEPRSWRAFAYGRACEARLVAVCATWLLAGCPLDDELCLHAPYDATSGELSQAGSASPVIRDSSELGPWSCPQPLPEPVHLCGDGTRDEGEACDDGNATAGDGCDATCELDDNQSTVGDDRAGYFDCFGARCGPGFVCCSTPVSGCVSASAASSCNVVAGNCDGPEDCPNGQACSALKLGHGCGFNGFATLCHTDADCENVNCSGSGTPCHACSSNGDCYGAR